MTRHNLKSPTWESHAQGRECESCREITASVVWDVAQVLLACAALFMLAKSMGLA